MSTVLWLLLSGAAQAQECAAPLEPEAMAARLDAVKDGVLFGEPAAAAELSAIEASLVCLNGPVDQAELAELMLAQAAYRTFMGSDASVYYQRAARLGASDPDYGPEVQALVDAAVQPDPALLILDFEPVPAVMFVDGVITYSAGPRELPGGWHIVQWLGESGWELRVLELDPAQELTISVRSEVAEPPQSASLEAPKESARPERGPREGGVARASVALGYQVASSAVEQDGQRFEGIQGSPSVVLRARTLGTWHLRLGAELGPYAAAERTGSPARGHLAAGWQQDQGPELSVAAGALLGGASELVPQGLGEPPSFRAGRALGATLVVSAQPVDRLYVELQGQWIDGGLGGGVLAQVEVVELGALPVLLSLGGNHARAGSGARLSWVQAGVGTSLRF